MNKTASQLQQMPAGKQADLSVSAAAALASDFYDDAPPLPDIAGTVPGVRKTPELFYALPAGDVDKDRNVALEQIRVLRSRVLEFMHVRNMRSLLVTSAMADEGKTITSINLALALSQVQGTKVLLVDTDLRKPSIAHVLGCEPAPGLIPFLRSELPLEECVQELNGQLNLLSARRTANPVELLHSQQMTALIDQARSTYNIVIFDAPPLYCIADSQILSNYVDGVLMCIRAGHTSSRLVTECSAMVAPKLIGAVLVGGERQTHGYAYSYYSGKRK